MLTHPGVYCLRSSETDWDEDTLWRTYTTLIDVEAVFRTLHVRTATQAEPDQRDIYDALGTVNRPLVETAIGRDCRLDQRPIAGFTSV